MPQILAELSLLAAAAIWGFTFPLVKNAIEQIDVFEFLALRFGLATVVLVIIWPKAARAALRTGVRGGLIAGSLLALGHGFQVTGLALTRSTNTGFITGLYVVFTPVLAWIFLKRRISLVVVFGVVVTSLGLALMSVRFSGGNFGIGTGDLLVLMCAVVYAGQIVALARFAPDGDARVLLIQQLAVTAIVFGLAMPLQPVRAPTGWVVWSALITTVLGASVFGIGVQTWAQKRISPTRAAVIFAAEAPFAALFGRILADEHLPGRAWAGAALIFFGMIAVAINPAPATAEA